MSLHFVLVPIILIFKVNKEKINKLDIPFNLCINIVRYEYNSVDSNVDRNDFGMIVPIAMHSPDDSFTRTNHQTYGAVQIIHPTRSRFLIRGSDCNILQIENQSRAFIFMYTLYILFIIKTIILFNKCKLCKLLINFIPPLHFLSW